ncbi:MAG: GAF domain-containing protein, partial [Anaerolineae bacterium]|nr:GAF domain-containing protein [Anaerolineae bacterium]
IASGNLSQTISLGQSDEIGLLAHTFEIMRQEVAASRYSAEAWTDQLEARVQQRTKEMAALLEISTDISSNLDVDSILRSVVDTGRQLLDGQVSVLCLLSEIPQGLSVASFSGPRDALARTTAKVDTGLLADVVSEGKTIACNTCQECPILAQVNAEEMIAAPLRFGDTTIGAICVADLDPSNLTDDSARLLTFLANSAAIALENARLFNRSQTAATLAERERIAAEMHDGLAQTLGYLNLKTGQVLESLDNRSLDDAINHVETMQPAIQQAYSTIRQALVGLSDNSLPQSGFKSQLENCIADFTGKNHAQVDLSVDEACLANIPHQAEQQLIRIAQESLANIRQHSDASKVTINILPDGDFISMTIVDNGCGFDLTAMPTDDQPHIGLKIMRGRIERVGGTLMIQSHPGEGTTISASVPAEYVSQLL